MVLIAVLASVILAVDLLRVWFRRGHGVAHLFLAEALGVGAIAIPFVVGRLGQYRIAALLFGAFFILVIPFLWRDARLTAGGLPPIQTVFPTKIGTPGRVIWGVIALLIIGIYSVMLASGSEPFAWETFLELAVVAATAGYVALTSRVPAWTAKVFGANQRAPKKTPDAGAS